MAYFRDSFSLMQKDIQAPPAISSTATSSTATNSQTQESAALYELQQRIGNIHFNQRLGIEQEKEARVFGQGRTFFHIENWALVGLVLKYSLAITRLIKRGRQNARAITVRKNQVYLPQLPKSFDGYTLLHISDLHLDMAEDIPHTLIEAVRPLEYDLCVLTGDFRAQTYGDHSGAIDGLRQLRPHLRKDVFAVLGNHDSIRMVPEIEDLNIQLLLNEHRAVTKMGESIYLAGIDDPHYYRADNFEKAALSIPQQAVSILLAHSPEIYKHAAFANFDLMLCGHTHGGQICLPGNIPLLLNANCPREYCIGAWKFRQLHGYTSVGSGACVLDVRFNCPPEITLHTLISSSSDTKPES